MLYILSKMKKVVLFISTLGLMGCSSYEGKDFLKLSKSSLKGTSSSVDASSPVKLISKTEAKVLINQEGMSQFNLNSSEAQDDIYYKGEFKVSFEKIYKPLYKGLKTVLPYACKAAGISRLNNDYKKDEIPCGDILNDQWKQLLTFQTDEIRENVSGFNVQLDPTNISVWLGRNNHSGSYQEKSLNSNQTETLTSSRELVDDLSIRYQPKGSSAVLDVCLNIPGTDVYAPLIDVKGSIEKKILGVNIRVGASGRVTPGMVSYNYLRFCVKNEIGFNSQTGMPFAELQEIQAPHIDNARITQSDIRFDSVWLQLVDGFMRWFGLNIKHKIYTNVRSTVQDLSDDDMKTSRWLIKVSQGLVGEKAADGLRNKLVSQLTSFQTPSTAIELAQILQTRCEIMISALRPDVRASLPPAICATLFARMQISLKPFNADPDSQAKGCYEGFARFKSLDEERSWKKDCKFSSQIVVRLPGEFKNYGNLVSQVLSQLGLDSKIEEILEIAANRFGISKLDLIEIIENIKGQRDISNLPFSDLLNLVQAQI